MTSVEDQTQWAADQMFLPVLAFTSLLIPFTTYSFSFFRSFHLFSKGWIFKCMKDIQNTSYKSTADILNLFAFESDYNLLKKLLFKSKLELVISCSYCWIIAHKVPRNVLHMSRSSFLDSLKRQVSAIYRQNLKLKNNRKKYTGLANLLYQRK